MRMSRFPSPRAAPSLLACPAWARLLGAALPALGLWAAVAWATWLP